MGCHFTANHNFLNYTEYAHIRQVMLDSLSTFCDHTLRTLLDGDPYVTTVQKRAIDNVMCLRIHNQIGKILTSKLNQNALACSVRLF